MSFLEVGFFFAGACIGLLLSFFGAGAEPDLSFLFAAQILLSVTLFPALFLLCACGILSLLPDHVHETWIRRLTFRGWY